MKLNKKPILHTLTILTLLFTIQIACAVSAVEPNQTIPNTPTPTSLPIPTETEIIPIPIHPTVTENYKNTFAIVVNCNYLNIRKEPNNTSEIITIIPVDTRIQILNESYKENNDWYFINYENIYGYVHGDYIQIVP